MSSRESANSVVVPMDARAVEAAMLDLCTEVGRGGGPQARDQREANLFWLAATLVQTNFPGESRRLLQACDPYFLARPDDRLPSSAIVQNGWVASLPRLRDMLNRRFS